MTSLILYKPGDKLEVYGPGETISPWNKSRPLLFFRFHSLEFSECAQHLATRLSHHLKCDNRIFIGDIVSKTREKIQQGAIKNHSTVGVKSMVLLDRSLARAGLSYEMKVFGGWPPEDLEEYQKYLPHRRQLSVDSYLPSRPAL